MDVSIIIVNYNTKQLLADCLKSIYEQTKNIDFEVIVSDNGSKDGSIEMLKQDFPQVILIENNANLGFGAANNRGLEVAKGKYIFYLNSDTILLNNAVKIFFDYWEENGEKGNLGALGCNLLDSEGNITLSYGNSLGETDTVDNLIKKRLSTLCASYKVAIKYYIFRKKLNTVISTRPILNYTGCVGYITGADLFLKNDSNAIFDEKFFLYYEETDLQWRLSKKELNRVLISGPQIVHYEGGSEKKVKLEVVNLSCFSAINLYKSSIYFLKKNHIASSFQIYVLKILTFLIWINPLVFSKTRKHIFSMFII